MILENLLRGMTVPGRVPKDRIDDMREQLSMEQKSIFIIQNLVGEIVRLHKLLAKKKMRTIVVTVFGNKSDFPGERFKFTAGGIFQTIIFFKHIPIQLLLSKLGKNV